jgi:glycolate oxidase iron-sulfur subunit
MSPSINAATQRVLDRLGIAVEEIGGCCGALRSHLGQRDEGEADMRRLARRVADRLGQAEVLLSNASGCGVTVKDYAHALPGHPDAKRTAAATRDLGEWLFDPENGFVDRLLTLLGERTRGQKVAYHPPCTLQHGQKLKGGVEAGLRALGFDVHLPAESHLCCGSAGTYSVLQASTALALRDRKLENLAATQASVIASANIGCLTHLQSGTSTPVRHWIELIDEALSG